MSSILLNSEAWYSIDKRSVEELEKVDNILLNKIFELPSSTPAAFIHLELGTLPIRYIIMVRRLMFLQYILKEQEDTLVHSFLIAQMEDTLKGDWWETVQNNIAELELNISLADIKMMSIESFKNKVKTHAAKAAFHWLNDIKERSKKIGNIQYSEHKIQNYLLSEKLSVQQRKLLTHLRCKMTKVRANYTKMYESIYCQLCLLKRGSFEDSQEHIVLCKSLSEEGEIDTGTDYFDIFSEETNKQEKITILIEEKLKKREQMLKKQNITR